MLQPWLWPWVTSEVRGDLAHPYSSGVRNSFAFIAVAPISHHFEDMENFDHQTRPQWAGPHGRVS